MAPDSTPLAPEVVSSPVPTPGRLLRLGIFLFFLVKGLIWLGVWLSAAWLAWRSR